MSIGRQEIDNITRQLALDYPQADGGRRGNIIPLHDSVSADYELQLYVVFAAVGVVLLVACVNLANMLLARSAARRREIVVRVALGASRWSLVRQFLTEAILLSLLGWSLGILLAFLALTSLARILSSYLPTINSISIDVRVLLFALLVSGFTAIVLGSIPAFVLGKTTSLELRGGGIAFDNRHVIHRWPGILIGSEIAFSLVLLTAAGLLSETLLNMQRQDAGMVTDGVLTFKIAPSPTAYRGKNIETALIQPLLQRLGAIPGVTSAGMINLIPLENWGSNGEFTLPGRTRPRTSTNGFLNSESSVQATIQLSEFRYYEGAPSPITTPWEHSMLPSSTMSSARDTLVSRIQLANKS